MAVQAQKQSQSNKGTHENKIGEKELDTMYRSSGILLNLRSVTPQAQLHSHLNSGIKLINSMTYSIPSLTTDEPWVKEIGGDGTTIVSSPSKWKDDYLKLQTDPSLYQDMKQKCIERAKLFTPEIIAQEYITAIGEA